MRTLLELACCDSSQSFGVHLSYQVQTRWSNFFFFFLLFLALNSKHQFRFSRFVCTAAVPLSGSRLMGVCFVSSCVISNVICTTIDFHGVRHSGILVLSHCLDESSDQLVSFLQGFLCLHLIETGVNPRGGVWVAQKLSSCHTQHVSADCDRVQLIITCRHILDLIHCPLCSTSAEGCLQVPAFWNLFFKTAHPWNELLNTYLRSLVL